MKTTTATVDIGDDLVIARTTRRDAGTGTWAIGVVNGHHFEALVFPCHAERQDYELGNSRISKLWLQELFSEETTANFDRGWDIRPRTKIAVAIVDYLVGHLADLVYKD
jgi:hypothetical protein